MSARVRLPVRLPDLLADDRALLARFADRRDEAAFAALVKRHGGMVLGVCRRAVRDAHLAEDAFQAVFLVLARDPGVAGRAASVGGWLFGVARRVGLAARRHERRRAKRDRRATPGRAAEGDRAGDWDDLLRVLDDELVALPDEYRAPLLACFLRGRTQDDAARELGWSLSTLRRRLDRGKELLRSRLARRGAALSAGLVAGALAPSTAFALPNLLPPKAASPMAHALAARALGGSVAGKLAAVAGVLVVAGLAAGFARQEAPPPVPPPPAIAATVDAAPATEWVTVTGRVVFPETRELPARREITTADGTVKDAACCFADGRRLFHEDVLIDPTTRGLRNAVVWLRPDAADRAAAFPADQVHPALTAAPPKEHRIAVADCQFAPRITLARAGDTLRFDNPGPLPTNVRYAAPPGPGAAFNVLLPAKTGSHRPGQPLAAAAGPAAFRSGIYPWMAGYVWAFDHPYAAVTDPAGTFTLPNAPAGTWRLVVWHEAAGSAPGRRVTLPAAGGVADLGPIALDSDRWGEPK